MVMEVSGNWRGYYLYGAGYVLPHFGKKVDIVAILKGSGTEFEGKIVQEIGEYGIPIPASIKGYIDSDFISFVKTYPCFPVIKDPGSKELEIQEGELEVFHDGFLDITNDAIYGIWRIPTVYINDQGEEQIADSEGIWCLWRVTVSE
jgi:hypothetical protein